MVFCHTWWGGRAQRQEAETVSQKNGLCLSHFSMKFPLFHPVSRISMKAGHVPLHMRRLSVKKIVLYERVHLSDKFEFIMI